MATQPQRNGPFPGFSPQLFQQGMQMGTGGGPQQFMSPYREQQGGGSGMPPMGGMPPMQGGQQMGAPMGGGVPEQEDPQMAQALHQAINQTPGLAEAISQNPELGQYIAQAVQQGPGGQLPGLPPDDDETGLGMFGGTPQQGMGAPQQAGQQQPGFWRGAGQYLESPEGKDSLMMGLIMSRIGVDPQGALQMALQFKQQKNQRAYQGEQNKLAQESAKENAKIRAEGQKAAKEQATFDRRVAKLQAGLQSGEVPPERMQAWVAENGPVEPSNIDAAENHFAQEMARVKADEKADKARKTQVDLLGRVAKGTLPASAVKNFYKDDPEVAATADALETQFKDMYKLNVEVKKERAEQLKQAGKLAAKMGDAAKEAISNYKEDTKLIDDEVDELLDTLKDPDKIIQYGVAQSLVGEGGEIDFKKAGQEILNKVEELRAQRVALGNQRFKTAGGTGPLPKPERVTSGAPKAAVEGYAAAVAEHGAEKAERIWRRKYGTDPPE